MDKTKYEIKRVGVFSAAKTCFLMGGFSGFLTGLFYWLIFRMIWWAGMNSPLRSGLLDQPGMEDALSGLVGFAGLILPFFGAIGGAVSGVVGAVLLTAVYNLGARIWGGLEMELVATAPAAKTVLLAPARPGEATPLPGGGSTPEPFRPPPLPPKNNDNEPPDRPSAAMFE